MPNRAGADAALDDDNVEKPDALEMTDAYHTHQVLNQG
jgi:hypothetical protein